MRNRAMTVAAAMLALVGCSGRVPDPATGRLKAGQPAMLYAPPPAEEVTIYLLGYAGDSGDMKYPVGTPVKVIDDPDAGPGREVRFQIGLIPSGARCPRANLRPDDRGRD